MPRGPAIDSELAVTVVDGDGELRIWPDPVVPRIALPDPLRQRRRGNRREQPPGPLAASDRTSPRAGSPNFYRPTLRSSRTVAKAATYHVESTPNPACGDVRGRRLSGGVNDAAGRPHPAAFRAHKARVDTPPCGRPLRTSVRGIWPGGSVTPSCRRPARSMRRKSAERTVYAPARPAGRVAASRRTARESTPPFARHRRPAPRMPPNLRAARCIPRDRRA